MPGKPAPASARSSRSSAARAAAARRDRRRRLAVVGGGLGVLVLLAVTIAVAVGVRGSSRNTHAPGAAAGRVSAPPWDAPAAGKVPGLVAAAGLPLLQMEATDVHFHVYLDIVVNGQAEPVPAEIGIGARALSPLHTQDASGIVHIEAPQAARFTLGQLFTEWNVRLSGSCVGGVCADAGRRLQLFINGVPYPGDPTQLVLAAHQEIAILYGPTGTPVAPPAGYSFPAGS
jgi:hypothetical protein